MAQHAMPFLMVNYGCEMMFVITVRLEAQLIEPTKSTRIKSDIVSSMFSTAFMDELFRPQEMYTNGALRKVFTTISDTSIMKLSEHSMKKLYDLMSMAVKYQVLALHHPYELLDYSLNHLDALREVCPPSTHASIDCVGERLAQLTSRLTLGEMAEIRGALLNFLLDRRVKVSLFLERHTQFADGNFRLPSATHLPPLAGVSPPGVVVAHAPLTQPRTERFDHRDAAMTLPPGVPVGSWGVPSRVSVTAPRTTAVGTNVYRERGGAGDVLATQSRELPGPAAGGGGALPESPISVTPSGAPLGVAAAAVPTNPDQLRAYHNEMNYLSQLVGSHPAPAERITLSLFEDDADGEVGAAAPPATTTATAAAPPQPDGSPAGAASTDANEFSAMIRLYKMDADTARQENRELLGIISGLDGPRGQGGGAAAVSRTGQTSGDPDNLLDIMDDI